MTSLQSLKQAAYHCKFSVQPKSLPHFMHTEYMLFVIPQVGKFEHPMRDGWGLTSGEEHIIGSDGSANIYFMDPSTFKGRSPDEFIVYVDRRVSEVLLH